MHAYETADQLRALLSLYATFLSIRFILCTLV